MDGTALKGTPEEKNLASWVANLMMQRGFSYALHTEIELGHEDLVAYFVSQGVAGEPSAVAALVDRAMDANAHLFGRRDTADGIAFWISKPKLLELLQVAAAPAVRPSVSAKQVPDRTSAADKESAAGKAPAADKASAAPRTKPAEPAPAPKKAEPERPARKPRATPKVAAEEVSLDDLPVTQQYQLAVLRALHSLGGSGKAALIVDMIPTLMTLPEEHQGTYARGPEGKSEEAKYIKFVHSARRFLIKQGELDSEQRGIWAITDAGTERLKAAGVIK